MRKSARAHYVIVLAYSAVLLGCGGYSDSFTLYRASPMDPLMRIHIATFDTDQGAKYNHENCNTSATLFQLQSGVTVKYWCEKGSYKK